MSSSVKLDKLSVLVVEDLQPVNLLIGKILYTLGVGQVLSASNGEEGFEMFCRTNPDIVITDWHMPKLNGVELLNRIRKSESSPNKFAPVIMVTGFNAPERIASCRDNGVTEFMVKPFTAEDIIKRIAHVIKSPRDFVEINEYFGPDRRRRSGSEYSGQCRRKEKN